MAKKKKKAAPKKVAAKKSTKEKAAVKGKRRKATFEEEVLNSLAVLETLTTEIREHLGITSFEDAVEDQSLPNNDDGESFDDGD